MEQHTGEKPFSWFICDSLSYVNFNFDLNDSKYYISFVCSMCVIYMSASKSDNLLLLSNNLACIECVYLALAFVYIKLGQHTGEKPFTCPKCDYLSASDISPLVTNFPQNNCEYNYWNLYHDYKKVMSLYYDSTDVQNFPAVNHIIIIIYNVKLEVFLFAIHFYKSQKHSLMETFSSRLLRTHTRGKPKPMYCQLPLLSQDKAFLPKILSKIEFFIVHSSV